MMPCHTSSLHLSNDLLSTWKVIYMYIYISFLNAFLVYVNCKLYWNPAGSEAVFVFGTVNYNISCLDGMDTRIQMFKMLSAMTLPPDQSSFGKQIHANLT